MRTFFEDLGRKIGETAETVTNKAGDAVEIQRLRNQIRNLERGNERDYMELGRMVYDYYKGGGALDAEAGIICDAISNRKESIGDYEQQISDVKGDVACDGCGKSVSKDMSYCPYCGAKVPDSAKKAADMAKDMTEEAKEEASDAADTMREKVSDAADTMREKASDAADTVREKASDAADIVKEKAADVTDTMRETVSDMAGTVTEKAADMAEAAREKAVEAGEKVKQMTEE